MMTDPKFQQSLDICLEGRLDPEKEMELEECLMTEEGFRAYLLGGLKPEEHLFLEDRLWQDPHACEVFEMVEDELIEDYNNDTLTEHEMERFERFFVWTKARRQKLDLLRGLNQLTINKRNTERRWEHVWDSFKAYWHFKNPALSWSLVAALLVIFVGGPWLVIEGLNEEEYPTYVASFLSPGLLRGSGMTQEEIFIPAGTDMLQLQLTMIPEDFARFRIVVEQVDGGDILTQIFPKTESVVRDQTLDVSLSAESFVYGDYQLKLSGEVSNGDFKIIENYYFRIVRD